MTGPWQVSPPVLCLQAHLSFSALAHIPTKTNTLLNYCSCVLTEKIPTYPYLPDGLLMGAHRWPYQSRWLHCWQLCLWCYSEHVQWSGHNPKGQDWWLASTNSTSSHQCYIAACYLRNKNKVRNINCCNLTTHNVADEITHIPSVAQLMAQELSGQVAEAWIGNCLNVSIKFLLFKSSCLSTRVKLQETSSWILSPGHPACIHYSSR